MNEILKVVVVFLLVHSIESSVLPYRPNIVIIQVDDMGSYDASYRGSNQFLTPNIDALAFNGVILNRFYTPPMCTPSRSSAMTGKDPFKLGMQHFVILPNEAWGLGLDEKLISNYFQDAGYSTHLIGKWHLGHFAKKYTPTRRGFDTFYGYYNGLVDYYSFEFIQGGFEPGYDFRRNFEVNYDTKNGTYATDLFTDEAVNIIQNHADSAKPMFLMLNHLAPHTGNIGNYMQAPDEEIEKFSYIEKEKRQILAAMIAKADESVGRVVSALEENGLLENTIILFYSDNGAPTHGVYGNGGSNYPLRDQKASAWEGASRNLGFVYSPLIKQNQRVHDGYFHTSDILPTLGRAAGINVKNVDGFDQWDVLKNGGESPRNYVVNSLDTIFHKYSMILDEWKLVSSGGKGEYLGEIEQFSVPDRSYANAILSSSVSMTFEDSKINPTLLTAKKLIELRSKSIVNCNEDQNPLGDCEPEEEKPCLYHIINDPCERTDLFERYPKIADKILKKINYYVSISKKSRRTFDSDILCDPKLHNGTWSWWVKDKDANDV